MNTSHQRVWPTVLLAAAFLGSVLIGTPSSAADKAPGADKPAAADKKAKDAKKDEKKDAAPVGDTAGFAALDVNSDGSLTMEEFLKMTPGTNGAPAQSSLPMAEQSKMRKQFEKMDKNRDRKVSDTEYSEATAPKIKQEPPKQTNKKGNVKKLMSRTRQMMRTMQR